MTATITRLILENLPLAEVEADWLIVGVTEGGDLPAAVTSLDAHLNGDISRLRQAGDLNGKHLELVNLLTPRGIKAKRVCVVGLGRGDRINRAVLNSAAAAAMRSITGRKHNRVALALPEPATSLPA